MHSRPEPSTEVRGTGENVAQMFIPHVLMSLALDESFNLIEPTAKAIKHRAHVSSLLHRDNARVILLVYPNKEILVDVVPDSARVRPVTCHARASEKRGDWFVKQEVIVDQLLLFLFGHSIEWIVAARKITWKLCRDMCTA